MLFKYKPPTFPDGLDIEIFKFTALKKAAKESVEPYQREHAHISLKINFSKFNHYNKKDLSTLRWTLDDPEDLEVISNIFEYFNPNINFGWQNIYKLYNDKPELFKVKILILNVMMEN